MIDLRRCIAVLLRGAVIEADLGALYSGGGNVKTTLDRVRGTTAFCTTLITTDGDRGAAQVTAGRNFNPKVLVSCPRPILNVEELSQHIGSSVLSLLEGTIVGHGSFNGKCVG